MCHFGKLKQKIIQLVGGKINMRKVRSKHNNLLNYFLYDEKYLSKKYVSKCKKFFKELNKKQLEVV